MHTHYSGCSLQGNTAHRLALVTQVPSFPLAVGYQKKKCLHLSQPCVTRIKHFSSATLVNQQQIIFRVAGRPWAGWLAGWRGGARLRYLLCSVSVPLTGYIRRREARAGSCLLFLLHTSLQDFIILQVNK